MSRSFPILIAEDEAVSRKVMVKHLTKAGYDVTAVENGRQALEAFKERFYPFVLPDTDMSGARTLSEMLRQFVAQATIKASGYDINITASFGLAGLDDTDEATPEILLNLADENLYRAKEEGRNRVVG
jgi:diguanylate cyclase (GGDEF)-like protein